MSAEAMGETAAARYLDNHLGVLLAGPVAAECLSSADHTQRERCSLHESAHAVASWRVGRVIDAVVISSEGGGLTTFAPRGGEPSRPVRTPRETMYGPRGVPSDARQAVAIAWLLRPHSRKAARELLRVRRHESRLRVNSDAHLIRAVAARLLEVGALSGSEVENVIEETLRAQWRQRLGEINGIQNQTESVENT